MLQLANRNGFSISQEYPFENVRRTQYHIYLLKKLYAREISEIYGMLQIFYI